MNKRILIAVAAAAFAWSMAGCAGTSIDRNYVITSVGYAEKTPGAAGVEREAYENAKTNLLENLQIFMDYEVPLSDKMVRNILFGTSMLSRGYKKPGLYCVTLSYSFDLYRFVVDNLSFKEIRTWKFLGLDNYYSDYMRSGYPIGIWLKKNQNAGRKHEPTTLMMLSAIPVYSGFFNLNKGIEAGFFTSAKSACALTAAFHPDVKAKMWSLGGLILMTALDMWAVYTGSDTINKKLNALEQSVINEGAETKIPVFTGKF